MTSSASGNPLRATVVGPHASAESQTLGAESALQLRYSYPKTKGHASLRSSKRQAWIRPEGYAIKGSDARGTSPMFFCTMCMLPILLTLWMTPALQEPDSLVLVDFTRATANDWFVVNDGVMGGRSSSDMEISAHGTGPFAGRLSLENNGGFASVRTVVDSDLSSFQALVFRVRGDGRTYRVRLRTDGIAYRAEFDTEPNEWITVALPFDRFVPTFRGYVPRDAPPLNRTAIRQLGFLIGDKRQGPFRLEVERVVAVRKL